MDTGIAVRQKCTEHPLPIPSHPTYPASKGVKFTNEVGMRILGVLCTLVLFLFLIAPAPGYAQDENKPNQPQDDQKAKDNDKAKQNDKAKPEDKTARPDEGRRQEEPNAGRRDEHQNQPEANRPQEQRNQGQEQRPVEQQPRPMDNDHRAAQNNDRDRNQNAGNRGRRIPDDQFRSHFGSQHRFHVQRDRVVNVSQPVVVYGGYSFQLVDAWPAEWSYDDDCYIDYIDGEYFLVDVLHPGIRIAVFVVE